jgi:hypothetical protein
MSVEEYIPIFVSTDHIRSLLIHDLVHYPTIQQINSFNEYIKSWQNAKNELDIYAQCCSNISDKLKIEKLESPKNPEDTYDIPIRPYLDILIQIDDVFKIEGAIDITEKSWDLVKSKKVFIFKNIPTWVYNNKIDQCEYVEFRSVLQEWVTIMKKPGYNIFPLYRLLGKFAEFGISYCSIVKLINKKIKQLKGNFEFLERRLSELIEIINRSIVYEYRIRKGETIYDLTCEVVNGDYKIINDGFSQNFMKTMMNAIRDTPGSKEWFMRDGTISSKSPILQKLSSHSDVEKCGHTGTSMSWTLAQFRDIYRNGWNVFVTRHLIGRGVGWNQFDFATAFKYENEDCCLYHVKKMDNIWTSPISLSDVIDKIIKFEWAKLGSCILEKYGNIFVEQDYVRWTYYCDKTLKNGIYHIFKNMWNHYYSRKVYIGDLPFNDVVRAMWKELAQKERVLGKPPTDAEIQEELEDTGIYRLKGVFMCCLEKTNETDCYWFDKTMNCPGRFKELVKELRNK